MGRGGGVDTLFERFFISYPHASTACKLTLNKYVTRSNSSCYSEATPKISEQSCFARGLLAQEPVEVFISIHTFRASTFVYVTFNLLFSLSYLSCPYEIFSGATEEKYSDFQTKNGAAYETPRYVVNQQASV